MSGIWSWIIAGDMSTSSKSMLSTHIAWYTGSWVFNTCLRIVFFFCEAKKIKMDLRWYIYSIYPAKKKIYLHIIFYDKIHIVRLLFWLYVRIYAYAQWLGSFFIYESNKWFKLRGCLISHAHLIKTYEIYGIFTQQKQLERII